MYNIMEHPEHVMCKISNCLLHLPSSGEGQGEQLLALSIIMVLKYFLKSVTMCAQVLICPRQ